MKRNLVGQIFGNLTVIEYAGSVKHNPYWLCACTCGSTKKIAGGSLVRGLSKSCGCRMRLPHDLSGNRYGRLIAQELVRVEGKLKWKCLCDCGRTSDVLARCLTVGHTRSCGCFGLESKATNLQHGMHKTAIYKIWTGIISRCSNPNNQAWKHYGGRGIRICDEWRNDFMQFYADVGPRPSAKHSIDRYPNPNGNYEPCNVRWATQAQQIENRKTTIYVTHDGLTLPSFEWAKLIGIGSDTIRDRIKAGLPTERVLAPKGQAGRLHA
jgi:hypothetical protein